MRTELCGVNESAFEWSYLATSDYIHKTRNATPLNCMKSISTDLLTNDYPHARHVFVKST